MPFGQGRPVKPLRVNEAQVEDLTGGEVEEDGLPGQRCTRFKAAVQMADCQ